MSNEEKSQLEAEQGVKQLEADTVNTSRGETVGTRIKVGATRGRNPIAISYEAYDESQPKTLPLTIADFMATSEVKDEATLVSYLIAGFNDASYKAASDALAEYVENHWPADAKAKFRLVIRNYAGSLGISLDEAVSLIKPGFSKQFPG